MKLYTINRLEIFMHLREMRKCVNAYDARDKKYLEISKVE